MVRYFYGWIPLGLVFGAVVLMTIPYLAVLVLAAVALAVVAALGALVWATVSALYALARSALGDTAAPAPLRADRGPRVALRPTGVGGGSTR